MTNIMYIINESQFGGAALSLFDILEREKDSIHPTVVIPAAGGIQERLEQHQIRYYILSFPLNYGKTGIHTTEEADRAFADSYRAALGLQEIIKKEKIQLIHINSSVSNIGAMAAIIAGLPYVWHVRELLEEDFGCGFLDKKLQTALLKCADTVVAISDCVRDSLLRKYGIDTVRIYNGISAEKYLDRDFSTKRGNCFLLAGAILPAKGQLEAVRAVNELVKRGMDVQLYIIGSVVGHQYIWVLRKYIEKNGLEPNIHILPFTGDLREFRRKCRYSITASRMEALGRVTIEAMLAGCIVIGADTGGTAEIIGHNSERGYLYRQGSYEDLAGVIQYALTHGENNEVIQKRAQDYALQEFDTARYGREMVKIYRDAIHRKEQCNDWKRITLSEEMKERYQGILPINAADTAKEQKLKEIREIWLERDKDRISIPKLLMEKGIRSVAVYGMGYLGCRLYDELEGNGIDIRYVMDRELETIDGVLKVVRPDEDLPQADAIVVTVLEDTDRICASIESKGIDRVVTLTEVLHWSKKERE